MISTVAFCPQPPALVPELASRAGAELAPLRVACAEAIGRLLADADDDAELLYVDDPYRVGYYVAAWTARG